MCKEQIEHKQILAMTTCLSHRGPNATETAMRASSRVALGHTRLSVIDLSVQANQPMVSLDGRYSIVFNG